MGKRYSKDEQDMILKEVSIVKNRRAVASKYGISEGTIRTWEKKRKVNLAATPERFNRGIEKENKILKTLLIEKELEIQILKDMLKKM